jgi:hypothetical protein
MLTLIKLELRENIRNVNAIGYFIGSYLAVFALFGIFFDITISHHWIIQLISSVLLLMQYWQVRTGSIFFEYISQPYKLFILRSVIRTFLYVLSLAVISLLYLPNQLIFFLFLAALLQLILDPMISILSIIANKSENKLLIWLLLLPFVVAPICLVNLCWQQFELAYIPKAALAWLLMMLIITYSVIPLMFTKIVKFC